MILIKCQKGNEKPGHAKRTVRSYTGNLSVVMEAVGIDGAIFTLIANIKIRWIIFTAKEFNICVRIIPVLVNRV